MKAMDTTTTDDSLSTVESDLGQALALIHRVLPHLDEPDHATRVQSALHRAVAFIEAAQKDHALRIGVPVGSQASATVEPEIVAVVAAAIAVLLGRPHKVLAVQALTVPPPHVNVWAFEGRTQIFMSHRFR